jgi:hypothetical protein
MMKWSIVLFLFLIFLFPPLALGGEEVKICSCSSSGCYCTVKFVDYITPGCSLVSASIEVSVKGDFGSSYEYSNIYVDGSYVGRVCKSGCKDTCSYWMGAKTWNITDYATDDYLVVKCDATSYVNYKPSGCNAYQYCRVNLSWSEFCCEPDGEACSLDEECCSGNCAEDYDGGKYCAPVGKCVHDGQIYDDGSYSPDMNYICENGTWVGVCEGEPDNTVCAAGRICCSEKCVAVCYENACAAGEYRRKITITNTENLSLLDYQILVEIDTKSLIDAGKMRSDCGDIRFRDSDEVTRLDYWVENCNSLSTKIWVKVPEIPASSDKVIYIYYGDLTKESESNFSALTEVELINPGFEKTGTCLETSPEGWVHYAKYSQNDCWEVNSKYTHTGSKSFGNEWTCGVCDDEGSADVWPDIYLYQDLSLQSGTYSVRAGYWFSGKTYDGSKCEYYAIGEDDSRIHLFAYDAAGSLLSEFKGPTFSNLGIVLDMGQWGYQEVEWVTPSNTAKIRFQVDGMDGNNGCRTSDTYDGGNAGGYFDDFFVFIRKYVSPEPSVKIGEEEYLGISCDYTKRSCSFFGCSDPGTCLAQCSYLECDYCANCPMHCGDGVCNCGEVPTECPEDCVLESFDFEIYPGWNLISLPAKSIAKITSDECGVFSGKFYYYNAAEKKYKIYSWNEIEGGKGYWIHSTFKTSCSVTVKVSDSITLADLPQLKAGYNLIGSTLSSYNIADIKGDCNILSGPHYWDGSAQKWVSTDTIEAGRGYWIKVANDCKLS